MHCTILDSFIALCETVASPVSEYALKCARARDWKGLMSLDVKPADYSCPRAYYGDAQVAAYLSKFPDFDLGITKKAAAEATFWSAEKQCYKTNERLGPLLSDPIHYGDGINTFVTIWRQIIRRAIGPVPDYTMLTNVKFGPGSTYANVGDDILLADKLDGNYTVTEQACEWLPSLEPTSWWRHAAANRHCVYSDYAVSDDVCKFERDPGYATRQFKTVDGNRFTTVPKNAKTDRGICIEASANVSMQLAVGSKLSDLMKRAFGWDKETCQEYHRLLARIGSLTGAVATIDLSNASDTVSKSLVQLLLPPAWFDLLDQLRSHKTLVNGKWVVLEKFSSMGNGFTFELETLIFRSLIATVEVLDGWETDRYAPGVDYSVFGDDIIVPTNVSASVVSALKFFGFTPNEKKTFLTGPFRESCGGDYYRGFDVRPHHVRKDVELPSELIALANGIRRFRLRYDLTDPSSPKRTVQIWRIVLNGIPKNIRACRGPEELGDLVIHDHETVWLRGAVTRNSVRYLRVWRPVANRVKPWEHYRPGVVMACALYGVPSGTPPIKPGDDISESWRRSGVVPRIRGSYVSGYRFGRIAFS